LLLGLKNLLLEGVGLAKTELDLLVGVLVEDVAESVELVLNLLSVEGIKIHLLVLLSVKGDSGVSADDGGGEDLYDV
jgi:hypothetical protein